MFSSARLGDTRPFLFISIYLLFYSFLFHTVPYDVTDISHIHPYNYLTHLHIFKSIQFRLTMIWITGDDWQCVINRVGPHRCVKINFCCDWYVRHNLHLQISHTQISNCFFVCDTNVIYVMSLSILEQQMLFKQFFIRETHNVIYAV